MLGVGTIPSLWERPSRRIEDHAALNRDDKKWLVLVRLGWLVGQKWIGLVSFGKLLLFTLWPFSNEKSRTHLHNNEKLVKSNKPCARLPDHLFTAYPGKQPGASLFRCSSQFIQKVSFMWYVGGNIMRRLNCVHVNYKNKSARPQCCRWERATFTTKPIKAALINVLYLKPQPG